MTIKKNTSFQLSMPAIGMLTLGTVGALVTAFSFKVMEYWPLPVSVSPYFGMKTGLVWGLVVGAISGLAIGFLVDERYFSDSEYKP